MNPEAEQRSLLAMAPAIVAGVVVVMALGVGKLTGMLDPLLARRGVGAMVGLLLMVTGNFVPKLRLFQSALGAADRDHLDRFAGWLFVVCGLAVTAIFLWAPSDHLFIVAPVVILGGFLAVFTRWLRSKGKPSSARSLPMTPGRLALATMLATALGTGAIFLADAVWGDHVSRRMAILFPFLLIWFSAIRARTSSLRN